MANIALPLTANFVGEFLIFQGVFCNNTLVTFLGATSMIFSGGYSLLAYGRVAYGACKPHFIRRCDVKALISLLGNPPHGGAIEQCTSCTLVGDCLRGACEIKVRRASARSRRICA